MRVVVVCIILLLTSCRREHVCECKIVREEGPATVVPDKMYIFSGSLSSAETSCIALEKGGSDHIGEFFRDCEITQ